MRFNVIYSFEAKEELKNIPKQFQKLVVKAIEERIQTDPYAYGKLLRYDLKGIRSLRVSSYRVLYEIRFEQNEVYIVKIAIRRDVYE